MTLFHLPEDLFLILSRPLGIFQKLVEMDLTHLVLHLQNCYMHIYMSVNNVCTLFCSRKFFAIILPMVLMYLCFKEPLLYGPIVLVLISSFLWIYCITLNKNVWSSSEIKSPVDHIYNTHGLLMLCLFHVMFLYTKGLLLNRWLLHLLLHL